MDHLGHYNPRMDPPEVVIDSEKAREWMRLGAQPTDAVRRMIEKAEVSSENEAEPASDSE